MAASMPENGQIPTDPTQLVGLLLLAAAVAGQLGPEQVEAVTAVFGFAAVLAPYLPQARR